MSGVDGSTLRTGIDGCSAPTFHLPLSGLATALARVANPDGLSAPRRAPASAVCALEERLQFAGVVHLDDDIAAADQFPLDV